MLVNIELDSTYMLKWGMAATFRCRNKNMLTLVNMTQQHMQPFGFWQDVCVCVYSTKV